MLEQCGQEICILLQSYSLLWSLYYTDLKNCIYPGIAYSIMKDLFLYESDTYVMANAWESIADGSIDIESNMLNRVLVDWLVNAQFVKREKRSKNKIILS